MVVSVQVWQEYKAGFSSVFPSDENEKDTFLFPSLPATPTLPQGTPPPAPPDRTQSIRGSRNSFVRFGDISEREIPSRKVTGTPPTRKKMRDNVQQRSAGYYGPPSASPSILKRRYDIKDLIDFKNK